MNRRIHTAVTATGRSVFVFAVRRKPKGFILRFHRYESSPDERETEKKKSDKYCILSVSRSSILGVENLMENKDDDEFARVHSCTYERIFLVEPYSTLYLFRENVIRK